MQQRLQKTLNVLKVRKTTAVRKIAGQNSARFILVLVFAIGAVFISGCLESGSSLLKSKIADALKKTDTITVYALNHDANGEHENLWISAEEGSDEFEGAVEALTGANTQGTVTQIPFDTVVYLSADSKPVLKLSYCMVDGRLKEAGSSETADTALLIIPREFRIAIRD